MLAQTQTPTMLPDAKPVGGYKLAHIIGYIDRHIGRSLAVSELASEACMSEPNFYRVFRQVLGTTPVNYINQRRIVLAANLLRTTRRDINDICTECGFNTLTYFTRLFRREVGVSPARYRRQYQSEFIAAAVEWPIVYPDQATGYIAQSDRQGYAATLRGDDPSTILPHFDRDRSGK